MNTPLSQFAYHLMSWMKAGLGYEKFMDNYLNPALFSEKQSIAEAYESGRVSQHLTPNQTGIQYYENKYGLDQTDLNNPDI